MQDEKRRTKFNMLQRWEARLERLGERIIDRADRIDERRRKRAAGRRKKKADGNK